MPIGLQRLSRPTSTTMGKSQSWRTIAGCMIAAPAQLHIAGLSIALLDVERVVGELRERYTEFARRTDAFKSDVRNPHLCAAGCSHCCKQGAVFAVTLVEAVEWVMAIQSLRPELLTQARRAATDLLDPQRRVFASVDGPIDKPGCRVEPQFSRRIGELNRRLGPACPLLVDELCSVYEVRPMLCRAYGFPVDAYAVRTEGAIAFRSLCVLYEGKQLVDYVRAEDLKSQLSELSFRLAGNRDVGRFTSIEAILASVTGAAFSRSV